MKNFFNFLFKKETGGSKISEIEKKLNPSAFHVDGPGRKKEKIRMAQRKHNSQT